MAERVPRSVGESASGIAIEILTESIASQAAFSERESAGSKAIERSLTALALAVLFGLPGGREVAQGFAAAPGVRPQLAAQQAQLASAGQS